MIFYFPVENFLQIGAILNKLECLKIARPAPNLLKGIQLRDRKSGRRTSFYSGRELPLISDERIIPNDSLTCPVSSDHV